MQLDLRLPIGWMFSAVGLLLVGYGLLADRTIYARSLGVNVNLWWGLVLFAFGVCMLALARGGARKRGVGSGSDG
jgi:hypothetical protein